jgi:aryl-alcohol dehydrogenase-like predicted oxidoreductase
MLAAAMDAGINFFDNAEAYAQGESEVVMGTAFKALKWARLDYVVLTSSLGSGDKGSEGQPAQYPQQKIFDAGH